MILSFTNLHLPFLKICALTTFFLTVISTQATLADASESPEQAPVKAGSSSLEIGLPLPQLTLAGDDGGKLNDAPWTPQEHAGKVHMIFYVDPDERGDGEQLEQALKNEEFPFDKVGSSAIINMKAAAMPNFLIGMSLSSKQKKFPRTSYAKDFTKHLVEKWGLKDDAYNFLIASPTGILLYQRSGKPSENDIQKIIEIIKANLPVATK